VTRGAFQRAGTTRLLEIGEVGVDEGIVEAEVPGPALERVIAQFLPERIDRLGKVSSRPLLVGFGPEQGHELLTSHALPAGGGERGQQRQALGLRRGAFEAGSVTLKGEASENAEPEHEGSYWLLAASC